MSNKHCNMNNFCNDFLWGVSTSSYQIEGGIENRGKSNWDDFCDKGRIDDKSNGSIACDSYNLVEKDVELIKNLGVGSYRFSLSWPRLMPKGTKDEINQEGVDYYNKLINLLIKNNIKPFVTIFHWDLPLSLEEKGGWLNEDMVGWFVDYADFCFKTFGDRVQYWITINEPHVIAYLGYCIGMHAPGMKDPLNKPYLVSKHLILAHANSYRKYDACYRKLQNGKISIALNSDHAIPSAHGNEEVNIKATDIYMQYTLGWFADPIFLHGDFPVGMKSVLDEKQKVEQTEKSRLPVFSDEEKQIIKGSYDFFAINHYTSRYIKSSSITEGGGVPVHPDLDVVIQADENWEVAGSPWLYIVPSGLRELLKYISRRYGSEIPIFITENGCSTKHEKISDKVDLNDEQRVNYIKSYISEAHKAYKEDSVNLKGYFCWSLLDNFEWNAGYTERFGLYFVDFEDEKRQRTPKTSAQVYKTIVKNNAVVYKSL